MTENAARADRSGVSLGRARVIASAPVARVPNVFPTARDAGWGLAFLALSGLAIAAFFDAGAMHGHYAVEARGMKGLPASEVQFLFWYLVWGTLAVVMLGAALTHTRIPAQLVVRLESDTIEPGRVVVVLAVFVLLLALFVRHAVLRDLPITDDENVYDFIGKTVARGRFTNPIPPDRIHYASQFIVMNEHGWHGKYPIGHGLVIALIGLTGRLDVVGPFLGGMSLLLTFQVGRRFFGERRALLGALLLALSPHFVFTHATRVSQTTSCLAVLGALLATFELTRGAGRRWLVLAGSAFALSILARPMPGIPVVAVCVGTLLLSGRIPALRDTRRVAAQEILAVISIAAIGGLGVMLTNFVQSGSPWTSGYLQMHHSYGMFENIDGELTNSVGGALVRENVWLFGWPISLGLVLFGRPSRGRFLYFGAILAEVAYRVIAPKTIVSSTGPIYVTEIVPLLALGSADGAVRLSAWMAAHGKPGARAKVGAFILAAFVVAACTFVPIQVGALRRAATARTKVYDALARAGGGDNALIFCNELVDVYAGLTWAYYPPAPSPGLGDRQLFVRYVASPEGRRAALAFWRRRHPARRAFIVKVTSAGPQVERLAVPAAR